MTTKKLQVILVTETKISIKALNTEEMVEKVKIYIYDALIYYS